MGIAARAADTVAGAIAWVMKRSAILEGVAASTLRRFGGPLRWRVAARFRPADARPTPRIVPLGGGARMVVDLRDMSGILYVDPKGYEYATVAWVEKFLRGRPGAAFVDVGANAGYFGLKAGAVLRRTGGRVLAVEANPRMADVLARSIQLSRLEGVVTLARCAAGPAEGEADLYLPAGGTETGLATLAPWDGHLRSGALAEGRTVRVPVRTLDSLADEFGPVDLIKIDVEGFEDRVLAGAPRLLARDRPRVICETGDQSVAANLLRSLGYQARLLEGLNPRNPAWGNYLFEPEGQKQG